MPSDLTYNLRPAREHDYIFLKNLHEVTMRKYVEQIWGWDQSQQERLFRERFDPSSQKIITIGKADTGMLSVERSAKKSFLKNILLLPAFQNQGIGTQILRRLMAEAKQNKICLELTVLRPNPALRFYQNLGFKVEREDEIKFYLRYEASDP